MAELNEESKAESKAELNKESKAEQQKKLKHSEFKNN